MTDYLHHNSSIFHQETEDRASSAGRKRRPSDTGYTPPPLQPHTVPDGHSPLPFLVLKSRIHSRSSGHNLDLKINVDIKTFTAINTLTNSVKFPFVQFERNIFRWPVGGLRLSVIVICQNWPVTQLAKLPWSNEAPSQVTKCQMAQSAYDGLTNDLAFDHLNSALILYGQF